MVNCQGPYKLKEYGKEAILCQATIYLKKMYQFLQQYMTFDSFFFLLSPSLPFVSLSHPFLDLLLCL